MNSKKVFEITNYVFFSLVIVACLVLTIVLKLDWWAFVTCASTILYFVFLSDRNILNAIVGLIGSVAYVVVTYKLCLYGEMIYYIAFDIPATIVSFFVWLRNRESLLKVKTRKLTPKTIAIGGIVSAVGVVGYALILKTIGGSNVWLDSLVTVLAFIAAILVIFRCREQWVVWVMLYVAGIALWITTFDLLMLIMCSSCLISSVIGFINWFTTNKNNKTTKK